MDWMSGFNFSAGLVDFVLGWPLATKPYMLIVQGLVFAVIYYFVFDFAIRKFNLMTPGREAEEVAAVDEAPAAGEDKYITMASRIYAALGGASNVKSIENCTTRLRLVVNDTSLVDQDAIKKTGVPAVKVLDKTNLQVIVGTDVQFVADAMNDIAKGVTVGGDAAPKARRQHPLPPLNPQAQLPQPPCLPRSMARSNRLTRCPMRPLPRSSSAMASR